MADRLPAATLSDGLIELSENLVVDTQEHAATNVRAITTRRLDLKNHLFIVRQIYVARRWSMARQRGASGTRHIIMHTLLVVNVTREGLFS